jgi:monofunctional biosynthetic peptidoglycan transglycosylase
MVARRGNPGEISIRGNDASERAAPAPRMERRRRWRWVRRLAVAILALLLLPVSVILLYRVVPPPVTPLMLIREAQGAGARREWVPMSRISPNLVRAVIAAEDTRFCTHRGFDWVEIDKAYAAYLDGEKLRGASTVSQQVARNLFLWPGGGFVRKGAEAYLTVLIEGLLGKARILELYLNVAEWGPGVFGAEAGAAYHFGKHAQQLAPREAAAMAIVLPNPRGWRPERPAPFLRERTETILARMPEVTVPGKGGCGS